MYSSIDSGSVQQPSGLRRLARRDLPTTPRTPRTVAAAPAAPAAEAEPQRIVWPELSIENSISWLLRGAMWIGILAVVGAIAGYGFTLVATPKYKAYADLVVDPVNLQVVSNDIYAPTFDQNSQLLDVESKLRILTSGNVLTRVVNQLSLADDPEFTQSGGPLASFTGMGERSGDPVLTAIDALSKKVSARREERSFVVTLEVTTEDAMKSVEVANAMVAAFQAELATAEMEGATRSAGALMDRLDALKSEVSAAEAAVQAFRRTNGLEQAGNGELVNAQSMSLLNQRLIDARQALVAVQSRYAELSNGANGRLNADTIQTPTMVELRSQYSALRQQSEAQAAIYGPLHPNRSTGDRQLAGVQAQINAEASRYVQSVRLEMDQAQRTVTQIEQDAAAARDIVATDGDAQVQLRELERDARAKADVYEAFLARARELTERQQFDTTNIRLISQPTPAATRSFPPRGYMMAGAGGVGGMALGIALALGIGFIAAARGLRRR